jgi:putative SbcD/Mre11-related phosphoesterase
MRRLASTTTTTLRQEVLPGVWLDGRLALWLADARILVVADLHWGYVATHRARGNLLPDWGDEQVKQRLDALVNHYRPAEMIWLGDTVHAAEGGPAAFAYLQHSSVPITLIAGNHDRKWTHQSLPSVQRGPYFLHHGDVTRAVPNGCIEIVGHHHPAVSWYDGAGGNFKLPALVASRERLVLPAFSPWAAGVDCTALGTPSATIWAVAPQRIFAVVPSRRTASV